MDKKRKLFRLVLLCAGVVYLTAVVGATVYSQTVYVQNLPAVTLGKPTGGKVPKAALTDNGQGGFFLNTVEQQDGPWGKRYVLKQITVQTVQPVDETNVFAFEAMQVKVPLALTISSPMAYDGMEVRLEE